jgi:hypothetical protein
VKDPLSKICDTCGLTNGSHRADSKILNQCPLHEGWMDWPTRGITTFIDSGKYGTVPQGTLSKVSQAHCDSLDKAEGEGRR